MHSWCYSSLLPTGPAAGLEDALCSLACAPGLQMQTWQVGDEGSCPRRHKTGRLQSHGAQRRAVVLTVSDQPSRPCLTPAQTRASAREDPAVPRAEGHGSSPCRS